MQKVLLVTWDRKVRLLRIVRFEVPVDVFNDGFFYMLKKVVVCIAMVVIVALLHWAFGLLLCLL